jgi:TolA-binding protein
MEGPLGEQGLFELAQKTTDSEQKIWYYEQIVLKFPGGGYADKAQFMIGFTRAEELRDYEGAEKAFRVLLDRYPGSELAESARWMLENMRNPDIPHLEGDPLSGRVPAGGS